jgi:hypothetical protein
MHRNGTLFTGLTSLSLSLGLLAGCAVPTVTAPVPSTPAATAPQPGAPAAQPGAENPAPSNPAPAALTPMTLTGTATFRGEPLAGYRVTVLDATTGQPVTLTNDLASAQGLAVLNESVVTDAQGQINLQVVGLGEGQALIVQVAAGNGQLEAVLTSDMQTFGAEAYTIQQAKPPSTNKARFQITELTTAIAKVAKGVLLTTQLLTPKAAAPIVKDLAAEMAALSNKLKLAITVNPNLVNGLVSTEGNKGAEAVKGLIENAGQLSALTKSVAQLVAKISQTATAPGAAAIDPNIEERLTKITYMGTVLQGNLEASGFTLSNVVNGQKIDANSGNLSNVTTQVKPSGSSSGPSEPAYVLVEDLAALNNALLTDATHLRLTGDVGVQQLTYQILLETSLTISRPVVIDFNGHNVFVPVKVLSGGVTLKKGNVWKHLVIGQQPMVKYRIAQEAAPLTGPVTLESLDFVDSDAVTSYAPVDLTVKGCAFHADPAATYIYFDADGGSVAVTGSQFTSLSEGDGYAIWVSKPNPNLSVEGSQFSGLATGIFRPAGGPATVQNSAFTNCYNGIYFGASVSDVAGITGNTFTNTFPMETLVAVYAYVLSTESGDAMEAALQAPTNTYVGDFSVFPYETL